MYIYSKDCSEIEQFTSAEDALSHLEAIDVSNQEYFAWDFCGNPLILAVDKSGAITALPGRELDQPSLDDAFRRFAEIASVDPGSLPSGYALKYEHISKLGIHNTGLLPRLRKWWKG